MRGSRAGLCWLNLLVRASAGSRAEDVFQVTGIELSPEETGGTGRAGRRGDPILRTGEPGEGREAVLSAVIESPPGRGFRSANEQYQTRRAARFIATSHGATLAASHHFLRHIPSAIRPRRGICAIEVALDAVPPSMKRCNRSRLPAEARATDGAGTFHVTLERSDLLHARLDKHSLLDLDAGLDTEIADGLLMMPASIDLALFDSEYCVARCVPSRKAAAPHGRDGIAARA